MKVLLDTHVLLWWLQDSARLQPATKAIFQNPNCELFWSAASTWELAIKVQLEKLRLGRPVHEFVATAMTAQGLTTLAVQHVHAARVAELPLLHRDPFDRLLVAQAAVEGVPLVTADTRLAAYSIECLPA